MVEVAQRVRCARWSSGPRTHSNPKTVIEVTICLPLTINLCQYLSMKNCRDHSGKLRKGMNSLCQYVMIAPKFSSIHARHALTAHPWTFHGREFRVRAKSTRIREFGRQFIRLSSQNMAIYTRSLSSMKGQRSPQI